MLPFKILLSAIVICLLLIGLKVTVFSTMFTSDELIPGVTDDEIFTKIVSNSTLGNYICGDDFADDVSGINIQSRSEIFVTNETITNGEGLFGRCCNSLIGIGYEEDYVKEYKKGGIYSGIFKNETHKVVFHIFEGELVEEYTGYYLVLTVYRGNI